MPRLFPSDVEHGKRSDDPIPPSKTINPLSAAWSSRSSRPFGSRRILKRILLGLFLLVGLYYFFKNMPTHLKPPKIRPSYDHGKGYQGGYGMPRGVQRPPGTGGRGPRPNSVAGGGDGKNKGVHGEDGEMTDVKHDYDGPIKFYKLAASLHAISSTKGHAFINRNVLFAASSVKSAGRLLPMACEMVALGRNHVHFALMGRDEISFEMLKEVNGVKDCAVSFHDSRPDVSSISSDHRMEVSSSAGLGHINTFMHPQAIITDGSGAEDEFMVTAFRERAPALGRTLIELPGNADQTLRWILRLDSASLKVWNRVTIDIVIHAQPAASGSLIRLLHSLSNADYFHSPLPRLTIELPHQIDEPTQHFLEDFKWPPSNHHSVNTGNFFSLRHRIAHSGLTPEENSVRFLESFWPTDPAASHVLVLSPQVDLSPLFFHYLKYLILEYKHSTTWAEEKHLMGISLDMPSSYLNDSSLFSAPTWPPGKISDFGSGAPFLWQAPNSNAALYFGEKWIELHSFVGQSLLSQRTLPAPVNMNPREVSTTYPSWLQHILHLVRARGYNLLYPSFPNDTAFATVHNELYHPPEEYSNAEKEDVDPTPGSDKDWTADPAKHLSLKHKELPLASTFLLNTLPSKGSLPSLTDMPLLSWDGQIMTRLEMEEASKAYSDVFRQEVGGCHAEDVLKVRKEGSADDLFCVESRKEKS